MKIERTVKNSIKISKILPSMCKYSSCLNRAMYEFLDNECDDIIIGHSCENHVEEVNKLLTSIYYEDEEDEPFFI